MSNPDDDPAFDINPDGDAAAYDEWAAAIASGLTKTQIKAASHPGSILVLAGAGTGKASTLTAAVAHHIAVDEISPHRVLAVTFTNKAAGEMASRIRAALGPDAAPDWLGTFHGLAARQLRAGPEVASLRDNFDILDADDSRRILRRIMKAMNPSSDEDEGDKRDPIKIVAGHIGKFKDLLMKPKGARSHVENRLAEGNQTSAPIDVAGLTMAAKVHPEYQTRLREANAADFGDRRGGGSRRRADRSKRGGRQLGGGGSPLPQQLPLARLRGSPDVRKNPAPPRRRCRLLRPRRDQGRSRLASPRGHARRSPVQRAFRRVINEPRRGLAPRRSRSSNATPTFSTYRS
jgi:UvrD/REP helicase N-terminal domain